MNRFFRVSVTLMAMMSFLVSEISGKGGVAVAKPVVPTPSVPNKGGAGKDTGDRKTLKAAVAVKTLKGNNNDDELLAQEAAAPAQPGAAPAQQVAAQAQQNAAAAQQGAAPAQPGAAPQVVAQTAAPMAPLPLSKMEKIIKHVTSRAYPYRCSVFAGDYCRRLCTRICVPPL